jgi:MYXO-CTERM domain-containing protein
VSCDKQCDVQLPKADCDAQCKASCQGSCTVQPNLDCQVDCQAKGYAKCEVDVMGGCTASCKSQKGALFCDGDFIDTGDKLESCVQALKDTLNAHVMTSASGDSSCDAGTCMASGMASASTDCSVARPGARAGAWPGLALFGLALAFAVRRRKQP